MDLTVRNFIFDRQEKGDGNYTHVSQVIPTGKFNISRKDTEEFWSMYQRVLQKNPKMVSGLAEKPSDFVPVLNDTDLKLPYNPKIHFLDQKLYKETHIKQTVIVYQKHLKQIIKDYKPKHSICFVLEKERPTLDDKNNISHGFHLHFIHTVMHKVDQDVHLIPRVRKEIDERRVFADIGFQASEEAIDKSCTTRFWLLYGSRKKEKLQAYKVTKIFDENCSEISLAEAIKDFDLVDIHDDKIIMDQNNLEYYLPRILSIHPNNREPVSLKTDLSIITKKLLKKAKESKQVYDDLPVPEALKKARILMKLISSSRADIFEDWIDIGWTLHSISDGTEEGLDLWIDFSSKTTKKNYFSEKVCMYEWEKMERKGKTIGSLYFYAKQDSPDEYKKLQKKDNEKLFNESLNGGHHDMAKWLFNKYGDKFVCSSVEKNIWYQYKDHRWFLTTKGINLRKKISKDLVNQYRAMKKKICDQMGEDDDDADGQKKMKTVNKIIASLKSFPFKNNIMKECEELFYDEKFSEKLDSDPYLLHYSNGILDLREMRFRSGRFTDYCSLTTGYDFKEHNWDDMEVLDVLDHLSKVFPDPILNQYFIEYSANLLKGGNNIKTFLNMSGEGDNGKSINMDLMKLALGDYMKVLPTSLIVGKRTQSSQATPELSGIQGVRFAILQEPNVKDIINIGILKELSGNDVIYIRSLYKESQEIRPMFKLALICNKLPKLPCDDPAAWNRIRVLPHESSFPKEEHLVPKTIEEQIKVRKFPRDPFFSEKLPKMKTAFMWIMWQTYKRIQTEGRMPEPEKVRDATSTYRKNNDVFLQFIGERIIHEPRNKKALLSVVELYSAFKSWFGDSYPNLHHQIPSKEDMKEELVRKWGELNAAHKWKGYRIRTLEDDEKDGKTLILRETDRLDEDKEYYDTENKEQLEIKEVEETESYDYDGEDYENYNNNKKTEKEYKTVTLNKKIKNKNNDEIPSDDDDGDSSDEEDDISHPPI
jgi:P4 family phage/plasmid primase-like protien